MHFSAYLRPQIMLCLRAMSSCCPFVCLCSACTMPCTDQHELCMLLFQHACFKSALTQQACLHALFLAPPSPHSTPLHSPAPCLSHLVPLPEGSKLLPCTSDLCVLGREQALGLAADHGSSAVQAEQAALLLWRPLRQEVAGR